MRKSVFRFKKFECSHGEGSMKIGVDAVLLGSWASCPRARRIVDVGTGCGVIALMCAQRFPDARVLGIDIDEASVREAECNFRNSPWNARLEASLLDFTAAGLENIDLIVSNPPYFDSGISSPDSPRLVARHQSALSPSALLRRGAEMLSADGRIAMIVPADQQEELCREALESGMVPARGLRVQGHPAAPVKRIMLEFAKKDLSANPREETCAIDLDAVPVIALETSPGVPTPEHRALCGDFYLKF